MKVIRNFKLADLLSATDIAKTPGGKSHIKGFKVFKQFPQFWIALSNLQKLFSFIQYKSNF